MGKPRAVLRTSRGILSRDDPSLTLDDVCAAFMFRGTSRETAASRAGAVRCLQDRADIAAPVRAYATAHGFTTDDPRELLTVYTRRLEAPPHCKCGRPVHFNRQLCQYATYCSPRCQNSDPEVKARHAATNMQRYGVANATMNASVKERQVATTVARYGATCFLATVAGKRKSRETCLRKYGVAHTSMVPALNERRRATMLARYGAPHALQVQILRDKRTATCKDRYGEAYPSVWKLRELCARQRGEVYDSLPTLFPRYEILCTRGEFLGLHEHDNTWRCRDCGATFTRRGVPYCRCHRSFAMEDALFRLVRGLCPDAVRGTRGVLPSGREIDVFVPSRNIGFEFDGLYWHSELYRDRGYHLGKTEEAEAVGVRLVHVFEDEWTLCGDITRGKIAAMLGAPQRPVSARKCAVRMLDRREADDFLRRSHIQGPALSASVHLGLSDGDGPVAVCTFGRVGNRDGAWYLERYATRSGCRVRGGCGRLLAAFVHDYTPKVVRTFADRRWSAGGLYESTGFSLVEKVRPAYWYVRPSDSPIRRIHRFNLRRTALLTELGREDVGETETELAAMCGYVRIWDCGQLAYEYRP